MWRWCSVTVCTIVIAGVFGEGVRKTWVKSWDLDSPANWEDARLPCGGAVVSLPQHTHTPMFVGGDLTLGSLDLPLDGEIIMGDKANLVFTETRDGACKDSRWTHGDRDQWWDPDGWSYPNIDSQTSSPVPDVHRVPCKYDTAVFANTSQSLYKVHLSPPTVYVSKLAIGSKIYTTTSELDTYIRTDEGSFRFVGASSSTNNVPLYVEIPRDCEDLTGCLCGTEAAAATICGIKRSKCPTVRCDTPIEMNGFCCPVCGAEVKISHNGSLVLSAIKTLLNNQLKTSAAKNVMGYAAKMEDGFYHVYFTASNDKGDYKTTSLAFKTEFNKKLNKAGYHAAQVSYSDKLHAPEPSGVTHHSVAATLITLIVCLAIGAAVYYLRKRRMTPRISFMFRRFENSSRRVSNVSDFGGRRFSTTSSVFMPSYSREGGLRFLNPIFNQSMASLAGAGAASGETNPLPPRTEQADGQRENPMYTAYQNMSPEERQANEDTLKAREKILEAAGDFVAALDTSTVSYMKESKPQVIPVKDLEVIQEEKETKTIPQDKREVTEDSKSYPETVNDGKIDPLGAVNTASNQEDVHKAEVTEDLEDRDESKSNENQITDEVKGSENNSEVVVQDEVMNLVDVESSTLLCDIDDIPELPQTENPDPDTSSSSSDDTESGNEPNFEGYDPMVNLGFPN